jgi:flagellar hook protein FlgE
MQTALTGLNAATTILEVTANNLANYETRGFKASSVRLATLRPVTQSPGGWNANPLQFGSGVQVVGIEQDFSQGEIQTDGSLPLLALQGEGLFILHSSDGVRLFSRDGQFHLDAEGHLINAEGDQLLGFGTDAEGQIDRRKLVPLTIRLGAAAGGANGISAILRSYSIARNGQIVGKYSDGISRTLGQLRLARFANPAGLFARYGNRFASTPASGFPQEVDPGSHGAATILAGATERSNVNIGHELIELTLAGNLFRGNLAVITTADQMLGALFFPWRGS